MKKVLSFALVVLLVLGIMPVMSVDSLAAGLSVTMLDDKVVLDDRFVVDFGYVTLGRDSNVLDIPIILDDGGFGPGATPDMIDKDVMACMELRFSHTPTKNMFKVNPDPYSPQNGAKFTLTPQNIGHAQGTIWVVFTYEGKVTRSKPITIDGWYIDPTINKNIVGIKDLPLDNQEITPEVRSATVMTLDGRSITPAELGTLEVKPGSEIRIRLHTDYFVWDPDITSMTTTVRKASLENDMVSIEKKILKGSDIFDEIGIKNVDGVAYVYILFTEDFNSLKERDFSVDIALAQRKIRNDNTAVIISGSISNDILYVDGQDYVFIGDGTVVEVEGYTKNIELDLDYGVSVFMNLAESKKYWGRATDERTNTDQEIMDYYPSLRGVLNLKTTNLGGAGNIVQLNMDQDYYVYDEVGALLGKTNERIPFRKKYFLSDSVIEFNIDMVLTPEDDEIIYSSTDNPQTGASTTTGFPMHLAGLSLLIAGALMGTASKRGRL